MLSAVILAGGRGERLRPLTDTLPKPMIKVNGKPFLQYQLELLRKHKILDVLLCVGFLHDAIVDHFGDGAAFGLKIQYAVEEVFLGTGGALKNAQEYLSQDFLLLYGDSYLPIDYEQMTQAWYSCNVSGLVACYDNQLRIDLNNIILDSQGMITSYNKRKPDLRAAYVEAGAMILKKDLVNLIPAGRPVSLEEDIFPLLIKARMLKGYPVTQRYYDIGTPERLKEAQKALV